MFAGQFKLNSLYSHKNGNLKIIKKIPTIFKIAIGKAVTVFSNIHLFSNQPHKVGEHTFYSIIGIHLPLKHYILC